MQRFERCASCNEHDLRSPVKRFAGKVVCPACWSSLASLERRRAFRDVPRTSLLALFSAEVAVRQPLHRSSELPEFTAGGYVVVDRS
jgi:hypothetical protein